jgi:outer membrane murein-binding lipoprotein Lpp
MVKRVLAAITLAAFLLFGSGCARINPRIDPKLDQKIDNQNGKIRDIESIQNGIKSDINGIKQNAEISNSKLDHVQNGLLNLQDSNRNSGIQIFSGSGGLVVGLCACVIIGFVALAYRRQAILHEKTADMLAARIVMQSNEHLEEDVFKAAMYTDVEEKVYSLIKKHQQKVIRPSPPPPETSFYEEPQQ